MKKLSKKIRLATIAASVSIAFATPAYSGAIATAILDITNLKFTNAATGANLNNLSDITILAGNNFGNLSADLTSVQGTTATSQNSNIFSAPNVLSPTGGSFNGAQICEGDDCVPRVEDNYSFRTVPPSQTATYSYADNRLSGTSIDLDTNGDNIIDIFAGVTASTIAEVMLDTTDSGNATSTTGTNFAFEFMSNEDLTVNLTFDFNVQALAFISPLTSLAPSSATAGVGWNIFLTDGNNPPTTYAPSSLQLTSSRNDIFTGLDDKKQANGTESLQFNLLKNTRYQVGITHQVQVNGQKTVNNVPEPGTLALLGLGLAAFAFPAIRRRQEEVAL